MPAPPPDARSFTAAVTRTETCGADGVLLRVRPEIPLAPVRASRFFMLKRCDAMSPLIPRPFSIYRQDDDELEFLIKVMGRGSRALAETKPGQTLRVIGPLGNGWPAISGGGAPWVFLAGGVGSAPFYLAIRQALSGMDGQAPCQPDQIQFLFGAATKDLLYDLDRFSELGVSVHAATIDGSRGFHGNVLELLESLQDKGKVPKDVRVLACGPDPMLEAVERWTRERQDDCWVSLETLMGCGVGICNGCPVPTRADGPLGAWPNAKCCVEGPVFSTTAVSLLGDE